MDYEETAFNNKEIQQMIDYRNREIQQMINYWKNDLGCNLLLEKLSIMQLEYLEDWESYFTDNQFVADCCAVVASFIRGILLDASNNEARAIGYINVLKHAQFFVLPLHGSIMIKENNLETDQKVYWDDAQIGSRITFRSFVPALIGELIWRLLVIYLVKYETEDSILLRIKTRLIDNQEIEVSLVNEDE